MAEFYGKDLYITWTCGTTITDMSEYQRGVTFSPTVQIDDVTTGAATYRTKKAGLKDFTLAYKGLKQAGGTAGDLEEDALVVGAIGTIVFGPEGTATGMRKYTLPAISQGPQVNLVYDGITELNVSFEGNGSATYGQF